MKVAITGASSNLGKKLTSFFLKKKCEVYALSRSNIQQNESNFKYVNYHFNKTFDSNFFITNKIDILILCAFNRDFINYSDYKETNLNANLNLIDIAKDQVNKIFFISSIASHENSFSNYGKVKYSMERRFSDNVIIIRPGMFFENNNCKELEKLELIINKIKIFPLLLNKKNFLYFTEINEFCELLYRLINHNNYKRYIILNPNKVFLKNLIIYLFKKNHIFPLFIPIPPLLIFYLLQMFEKIKILKKPISDALINLILPIDINAIKDFKQIYNKIEFNQND